MKVMETERTYIRDWRENDASDLYTICLDPELRRSGVRSYNSIEEGLKTIGQWQEQKEMWAIVRKADNRLIGLFYI